MQLSAEVTAFIQSGVSILVAAADSGNFPAVARAIGCRVEGGCTVLVLRDLEARAVLDRLGETGRLAVMFSRPSTNRSIQLKGRVVEIVPAGAEGAAIAARYVEAMIDELLLVGYGAEFTRAVASDPGDSLACVRFAVEEAFDQTPGPRAGSPLAP